MPSVSEVDFSGLNEWEKSSITSVMEKAEVRVTFTLFLRKFVTKLTGKLWVIA